MDRRGASMRLAAGALFDYLRCSLMDRAIGHLLGRGVPAAYNPAVGRGMVLLAGREIIRLVVRWVRLKAGVDH